ncbi:hypothetical protein E2C01_079476 [Portunus trituberculatus]|uniref:Uncharacterized protein n=1 Tax=Portunus trituberculatus TaxID=210409 RepID=A0A5B7IVQ8_PORTR|nr:hypothetical protein [Portunus trituberculatus]
MTFLNSSHLNETLLQAVRTAENISALQKTLLSLLQQLHASHACGPVNRHDIQTLTDILNTAEGNFPEQCIVLFIQLACSQVASFQFQTLQDLERIMAIAEENILFMLKTSICQLICFKISGTSCFHLVPEKLSRCMHIAASILHGNHFQAKP